MTVAELQREVRRLRKEREPYYVITQQLGISYANAKRLMESSEPCGFKLQPKDWSQEEIGVGVIRCPVIYEDDVESALRRI